VGQKQYKNKPNKREKTMKRYNESTSYKLQKLWDPLNNKYRNETNEERQERLLGPNMTFKSAVGIENELTAREINENNRKKPVRTIYENKEEDPITTHSDPVAEQQQESSSLNETSIPSETDRGWVLLDDGMTVVPESHPLWMSREDMIWNTYLREFPNEDLNVDRYGFSKELIGNIRRAPDTWRQNLAQGTTRNQKFPGHHSDAERILLTTQVSLSMSLEDTRALSNAVTDVCMRLGLYREENNEPEWRTRIAYRVKGWLAKYDIKPQIQPVPEKQGGKGHELNQEDRRLLKQDFDFFRSYNFNVTDSAELANNIHGTNRSGETIRGWFVNGVPKIKTKPSTKTASEVTMTNEPKENPVMDEGPVMDPRTAKWGIPAVKAGEVCPNCMTTCAECGHSQNSVHCADNLLDVGHGYIKMVRLSMESEANHIKMGSEMHQEVRNEVYNTVIDDIRNEVKGDLETENTRLKEKISKLTGTAQTVGSIKFHEREASIAEKARNEAESQVRSTEKEHTTLKRKVAEQQIDLKELQTKNANLLLNKTMDTERSAKELAALLGSNATVTIEMNPEDLPPPIPVDHQRTA